MGACSFDVTHYRELLEAVTAGGYRWTGFDHEPRSGDLFLRHDVDLSLDAALEVARIEHELGVPATYFLMTESVFYNLDSSAGEDALRELRSLGHAIGFHPVHPHFDIDERFDPVFAWHNPDPDFISEPRNGAANVMAPPYYAPGRYRSDSNQNWREGCPHDELAGGAFDWLQLNVHPVIWAYRGDTMRETMESMLAAKRAEWLAYLANDRIDLS
jgi:hypothetical protein